MCRLNAAAFLLFFGDVKKILSSNHDYFYQKNICRRTSTKTLVVCIQFPPDYPSDILLIELKSKTLSEQLLEKLTSVCEQELKKGIGKPQVCLITMSFLYNI